MDTNNTIAVLFVYVPFRALRVATIYETPIDQPAHIYALGKTDLEWVPFYIRNKPKYSFEVMTLFSTVNEAISTTGTTTIREVTRCFRLSQMMYTSHANNQSQQI